MVKTEEEKLLAVLSHVLCFVAPIIAPLVIWLLKKDQSWYVGEHAKESLNFQISLAIYCFISSLLSIILIGFVLIIALSIFGLIVVIVAAVRAYKGEIYRYPLSIRLIK
ncbi:DUF4870 domain-containing protein [Paenibacillus xerothermodurans]|uniref:DUF4870 domain-containing protein n=1 Tax=Paenibacillus xerothermodurans TaxID=1977292 RepID=A0A2W1N7N4_PAEXE|nr:DUF4870 domain-containing protein [Paenibacillus xerothermodurans]PZE19590.1 DUF4870 domain-containing protein [Paenibacillus xerothermodurans]